MENKFKSLSVLLMCIMLCCWTACSNDDDVQADDEDDVEYNGETEPMTLQDSLDIAFMNVISTLCETDSTFTVKSDNYVPDYGTLLYSVSPTVRYKTADSKADARGQFILAFASAISFTRTLVEGSTIRIDLGNKGSVEFEPAEGEGKLGVLNVDIPQIPSLTQVVWIQTEAWPQNAGDGGTYIGMTFKSRDGKRWVCVQTSEGGSEYGLLVTFDNLYSFQDWTDPACRGERGMEGWHFTHYYSNEHDYRSWLHWFSSSEDLKKLNRFMYNENGSGNEVAVEVFSNPNFMSAERYNAIYGQDRLYCCSDNTWGYTTPNTNTHKYKYWIYSQFYDEWVTRTTDETYLFMGNRWYVMNSYWRNSKILDDRWNSYDVSGLWTRRSNLYGNVEDDYWADSYRNYDKYFDHNTYIKVQSYHFDSYFYNEQTGLYADGFTLFDLY